MSRISMFLRSRRFIASAAIILVVAAAVITIAVLLTRPDYMSIRALGPNDLEQRRLSDYKGSKLWLHKNGTFSVKLMYKGNNEFVGIGRYKKNGKTYEFIYHDMYRDGAIKIMGEEFFGRDLTYYKETYIFKISKGRIEFRCPNNRLYYFK